MVNPPRNQDESEAPTLFEPGPRGETDASKGAPSNSQAGPVPRLRVSVGERFGDYEIIRLLGKGGMGSVYEARHLESDRRVALKLLDDALDSAEARKRFLREGLLAASINHPNSVYIHGTEEIDGIPVISMELVAGGTLKEKVLRNGPLPVREAVDTILQLTRGLDASHRLGVLHRDIKPANCFLDTNGTVKVGDYGLSISTFAQGEANLTITGTFMGTPAYSSPEQLRGDEVDVRSDIYAVGATLYFLLTGRTPFEAENVVKLLSIVLEQPAESPVKWRPEIPRALGAVVLQALEKKPEARFGSYEQFQAALEPFSPVAQQPVSLGPRFSAGFLDAALVSYLPVQLWAILNWVPDVVSRSPGQNIDLKHGAVQPLVHVSLAALPLLYFGFAEGLWGTTLGKKAHGLRLVSADGNAPGLGRAFFRAFLFRSILSVPAVVSLTVAGKSMESSFAWSLAGCAMFGLMFSTARSRNGYAGWHDLLSRTRVVRKIQRAPKRAIEIDDSASSNAGPTLSRTGPFSVLGTLASDGEWLDGYDPVLRRKVWIRRREEGDPPLPEAYRTLSRAARARWLTGRRKPGENWDAYAAPTGRPLLALLGEPQPWSRVRYWLLDVARESKCGQEEGSPVEHFALERVWITAEGGAMLLDFQPPGLPPGFGMTESTRPPGGEFDGVKGFIVTMAQSALAGTALPGPKAERPPLPLHARRFLASLATIETAEKLIETLENLLSQAAEIPRATRLKVVIGCAFLPAFIAGFSIILGVAQKWKASQLQGALVSAIVFWVLFTIIPSLACALIFGRGPLFRRLDLAIVTEGGIPAGRLRVVWRTLVVWFPILLACLLLAEGPDRLWPKIAAVFLFLVFAGGAAFTIAYPPRGLQDRIAGTWIVPQ